MLVKILDLCVLKATRLKGASNLFPVKCQIIDMGEGGCTKKQSELRVHLPEPEFEPVTESVFMPHKLREDRLEYYKRYYRLNRKKILARKKAFSQTPAGRARQIANSRKMDLRYPEKKKARTMLKNWVRLGKVAKPVLCQFCGSYLPLHGHHRDYAKPLDVQWLCRPCHNKVHEKD